MVQSLYFLNLKFQASSHPLWLYGPFCVGPCPKRLRQVFWWCDSNQDEEKKDEQVEEQKEEEGQKEAVEGETQQEEQSAEKKEEQTTEEQKTEEQKTEGETEQVWP